ncbi:RNA polymerase sporulation sigma factor SigH [Vallitalea guaymasensis]|uniref:RNA polymerase sigma factor SigS n=1 Tax=Vallitalea guaymasensis TaxID=1185412 RepID=A0A8J8SAQ0_9FIRM|nr:RNA polymerase sporulation sigma factor SigH [Vallitalea guaymasensis]QUH27595.1 RNA polymerase sporulation sigma factor SigH [Vallitalea guaymasensis]
MDYATWYDDSYVTYSDEQLVELVRDGDNEALDYLMNKYKILVEKKAKSYFLIGASRDDIIQEGMIGLFKAIRDFKEEKTASFYSFADLCVTRQIISAVKASTRQKHLPLNSYISLNKPSYEEENDKTTLIDKMPSRKIINPEDLLIGQENLSIIEHELNERLSKLEKEVLQSYIYGKSYVEIAGNLKRPVKSIDNALQRIKKKVELILVEKGV